MQPKTNAPNSPASWTPAPPCQQRTVPRLLLLALTMLLLSMLSSGCSTAMPPAPLLPPPYLLEDCPTPPVPQALSQSSNLREYAAAATGYLIDYQETLDICNADKAALRDWVATTRMEQE